MVQLTWIIAFKNEQNIRQCHKLHHECHEKFAVVTAIRYSNDGAQTHQKEMYGEELQFFQITGKKN